MPRPILPALLLLFLAPASTALAWSEAGHRMVGELAQRALSEQADAEVARLLAGEDEPTLAGVSAWADELRDSDPAEARRTAAWHYVNFPPGRCDYLPQRDCRDGDCIVAALEHQAATLADRGQPREARRDALKWVVHLVGDVHQPMHAGNRGDRGGNDYQISLRGDRGAPRGTNLHRVWDGEILRSRGLGWREHADALEGLDPPSGADGIAPGAAARWAGESCRLIDDAALYPAGHRLHEAELVRLRPLAEARIRLAAARLAALLEQALLTPTQAAHATH